MTALVDVVPTLDAVVKNWPVGAVTLVPLVRKLGFVGAVRLVPLVKNVFAGVEVTPVTNVPGVEVTPVTTVCGAATVPLTTVVFVSVTMGVGVFTLTKLTAPLPFVVKLLLAKANLVLLGFTAGSNAGTTRLLVAPGLRPVTDVVGAATLITAVPVVAPVSTFPVPVT